MARTSKKDGTVPADSVWGPKIAARILGKAVFLFPRFCLVELVPLSAVKL